jgi:hypothetical protein
MNFKEDDLSGELHVPEAYSEMIFFLIGNIFNHEIQNSLL